MSMRRIGLVTGVAAVFGLTGVAGAQTFQERLESLEQKVEEQGKGIAGALGVDIHALVSTTYFYSFNRPSDPKQIELRVETRDQNSIDIDQATLFFSRLREDEKFGFNFTLDFGTIARAAAADWNGDGIIGDTSEEDNYVELREAYLVYKTPLEIAGPISIKAGKFVTLLGYEILPTYTNLNFNVSESIMFGFSIAFTHTGLLANFPLTDMVSVDLGVVNGWDEVQDDNNSKTLLGGIGIVPRDDVSIYIAGTYGAEQPDNGKSKLGIVTTAATWKATDILTFGMDFNWANESDLLPHRNGSTAGLRSANWYGFAGYAVVTPIEDLTFALRAEVFDDSDGVRTCSNGAPDCADGQTLWELTPTVAYQLTDHITARAEYRHDQSDKNYFHTDEPDLFHTGNDTVGAQLVVTF
jgi:opacity protein-like surface antigen